MSLIIPYRTHFFFFFLFRTIPCQSSSFNHIFSFLVRLWILFPFQTIHNSHCLLGIFTFIILNLLRPFKLFSPRFDPINSFLAFCLSCFMLSKDQDLVLRVLHTHTHTHTHIYIYIVVFMTWFYLFTSTFIYISSVVFFCLFLSIYFILFSPVPSLSHYHSVSLSLSISFSTVFFSLTTSFSLSLSLSTNTYLYI